jgi:hypothetical protein
MNRVIKTGYRAYLPITIVIVLYLFANSAAWAQEKFKIRYTNLPENTTYSQQYSLEAGDVPGHDVRIYEIQRKYPQNPPKFNGISVLEEWNRGYSDYTDVNGRAWWYITYFLESGDKVYARADGTTQTQRSFNESSTSKFFGIITITGGTGEFKNIRGILR